MAINLVDTSLSILNVSVPNYASVKRIMIVDDHCRVRQGLSFALKVFKDLLVVGAAADGIEALTLCDQTHPNVVLMDIEMPHMNGIEATRLIRKKYPEIRVIMLTILGEKMALEAFEAGAIGFVDKGVSLNELIFAIRTA